MGHRHTAILVLNENDLEVLKDTPYDCFQFNSSQQVDIALLSCYSNLVVDEKILSLSQLIKEAYLSLVGTHILVYSTDNRNTINEAVTYIKEGFTDYFKIDDIRNLPAESEKRINRIASFRKTESKKKDDFSERYAQVYELMIKYRFENYDIQKSDILNIFPNYDNEDFDSYKHRFIEKFYSFIFDNESILAIEDEASLRNIYYYTFKKDYNVLLAENAEQGLEIARNTPQISIVLLDVFMPGRNGNEILPELKQLLPSSKIFLITAYKIIDIAVEALQCGAYDYINKPIDHVSLRQKIKKAVEDYHRDKLQVINTYLEFNSSDFDLRIHRFQGLIEDRQKQRKTILYKDLYFLFPEITEKPVFEQTEIPRHLIDSGVEYLVASYLPD